MLDQKSLINSFFCPDLNEQQNKQTNNTHLNIKL